MSKLYIFDLDDTLRQGLSGDDLRAGEFTKQVILPGVIKKLKELKDSGNDLTIASNQGFPSFGKIRETKIWEFLIYLKQHQLKNLIEDIRVDFYHPRGPLKTRYKNRRKPNPKMILELMEDYSSKPANTIFVGNSDSDRKSAQNANVTFVWAHDFFGWKPEVMEYDGKLGWVRNDHKTEY